MRDWAFSLDAVGCLRDGRRGGHLRTARTRLRPAQRRGRFLHQRNGEKSTRYFKKLKFILKILCRKNKYIDEQSLNTLFEKSLNTL